MNLNVLVDEPSVHETELSQVESVVRNIDSQAAELSFHPDELAERLESSADLQAEEALRLLKLRTHIIDKLVLHGDTASLYRGMPLTPEQKQEIVLNPTDFILAMCEGLVHREARRVQWTTKALGENRPGQTTASLASLEQSGRPYPELKVFLNYQTTPTEALLQKASIESRMRGDHGDGYVRINVTHGSMDIVKRYWHRGAVEEQAVTDGTARHAIALAVAVDLYESYRRYNPDDDSLAIAALDEPMV